MHYNVARVLAIVAFVATVVAASAATESRKTTPDTRAWSHSFHDDVYLRRDLRAHRHADEERAVSASTVENVLKSTVSADQLKAGIARGDTMNSVIKALQLQKVGDALLDSAQLTALIKYLKLFNEANPTKKTTLVATLTAHYGNQGLAKIIEAGQQVPKTARMANRLQTEQVQLWMGQGKTPEQVFGLLKLNKFWPLSWISSDLFNRPGLATWVKYLDDFNDANPDKKTTLISILSSRYSDKALANMLIQANKAQSTSSIAKRIQAEQTQLWLKHGKKPEDIFTMLQLEKAGGTLFENPLFSAWIKYADDFRLLYKTKLATMSTLMSHYSDEALARMIMAGYEAPSTANIAKRIWYNYGHYVTTMNLGSKWNPAAALTRIYGGSTNLADVLLAAEKVPSTKAIAMEILNWQVTLWLHRLMYPERVYSLLRVRESAVGDASRFLYREYIEAYREVMHLLSRNTR
ncbi:hypothetical protein AM587_10006134 [Phytophthora nicotianae]|uniref:RxLR effector PexRD54 WY domain-containing protein n=1 Tax=Phytophthora nicotianae TaxID=4792 RepID=A0A0W8C0A0_PHYNI|nr:hypothetical protein AM587_10006134 [Phytophthora nicotianae]